MLALSIADCTETTGSRACSAISGGVLYGTYIPRKSVTTITPSGTSALVPNSPRGINQSMIHGFTAVEKVLLEKNVHRLNDLCCYLILQKL